MGENQLESALRGWHLLLVFSPCSLGQKKEMQSKKHVSLVSPHLSPVHQFSLSPFSLLLMSVQGYVKSSKQAHDCGMGALVCISY